MGEVYEAFDPDLGTRIALKVIRRTPAGGEPAALIRRELLLARSVTHRNVCRVFDLVGPRGGDDPSLPVLAMELLEGPTLRSVLDRGPLSRDRVLALTGDVAAGLAAAHQMGVVHGDLKPNNVLVVQGAEGERAVLTDFGIAHAMGQTGSSRLGTPLYAAPELFAGGAATEASDVFAFGALLAELMGAQPLAEAGPPAVQWGRALRELRAAGVPRRQLRIAARCLAVDPAARYSNGAALVRALGQLQWTVRRGMLETAAAAVMLAAGIGLAWTLSDLGRPPSPPAPGGELPPRRPVAYLGLAPGGAAADAELTAAVSDFLAQHLAANPHVLLKRFDELADLAGPGDLAAALQDPARAAVVLGCDLAILGRLQRDAAGNDALHLEAVTSAGAPAASVGKQTPEESVFVAATHLARDLQAALGWPRGRPSPGGFSERPADFAAERLYGAGLLALRRGDFPRAQQAFGGALERDPGFAPAVAYLAEAHARRGDMPAAVAVALSARQQIDRLPRRHGLFVEALIRELAEDWRGAADRYQAMWTFYPDDDGLGLRLAESQVAFDAGATEKTLGKLRQRSPRGAAAVQLALLESKLAGARGMSRERTRLAQRALALASTGGQPEALMGWVHMELGQGLAVTGSASAAEAMEHLEQAELRFVRAGAVRLRAEALARQGLLLSETGDLVGAERRLRTALDLFDTGGSLRGRARTLTNLGTVLLAAHKLGEAQQLCDEAARLGRAIDYPRIESAALNNLAMIAVERGRHQDAASSFERSLLLSRRLQADDAVAATTLNLAELYRVLGKPQLARRAAMESARISRSHGIAFGVVAAKMSDAAIALIEGDVRRAVREIEEAQRLAVAQDNLYLTAQVELATGTIYHQRGDFPRALTSLRRADAALLALDDASGGANASIAMAEVALSEGRCRDGRTRAAGALAAFRRGGMNPAAVQAAQLVAEGDLCLGRVAAAEESFAVAERLRGDSDHAELLLRAELLRARVELAKGFDPGVAAVAALAEHALGAGFPSLYFEAKLFEVELRFRARDREAGPSLRRLAAAAERGGFGRYSRAAAELLARQAHNGTPARRSVSTG